MKSNNNTILRDEDLVNNPVSRVPICLCLDTSGSMGRAVGGTRTGEKIFSDGKMWNVVTGGTSCISEMELGIKQFYEAIREDETAMYSAEIAIVTFDDKAKCVEDFANIERQEAIPKLTAQGSTVISEGVNLALDLLEKRKSEYREKGVDYFQPWLVLMTDGEPNGDREALVRAINRTRYYVNTDKLTVFPIGIGEAADLNTLNEFSPKRQALRLQGLQFRDFFSWLSRSVQQTSRSSPGEDIALDISLLKQLGTAQAAEGGWDKL